MFLFLLFNWYVHCFFFNFWSSLVPELNILLFLLARTPFLDHNQSGDFHIGVAHHLSLNIHNPVRNLLGLPLRLGIVELFRPLLNDQSLEGVHHLSCDCVKIGDHSVARLEDQRWIIDHSFEI